MMNASENSEKPERFPVVDVTGPPFEMGRQIGEMTRDLFAPLVDHVMFRMNERRQEPISREAALSATHRFIPHVRDFLPDAMEETEGVAEGAGVTVEEVMLANVRSEVPWSIAAEGARLEGCTTLAMSKDRATAGVGAIGQNWDNDLDMTPYSVVTIRRPAGKPAFMTWGQAGIIAYMGFSEAGVGVAMNALPGDSRPDGVPWYFGVRAVYEATSLAEIETALGRGPLARSGNVGLITREGPADVEVQVDGVRVLRDEDGLLVHTNHCIHPDLAEVNVKYQQSLYGQTFARAQRGMMLLGSSGGRVSVDDFKTILSDHQDAPTSICRHPNDHPVSGSDCSVVSIIVEPDAGRMHLTRGNPCENPYEVYNLN